MKDYVLAALAGICSGAIHHQLDAEGKHRVKASDIAKRAREIGKAMAELELEEETAPQAKRK